LVAWDGWPLTACLGLSGGDELSMHDDALPSKTDTPDDGSSRLD